MREERVSEGDHEYYGLLGTDVKRPIWPDLLSRWAAAMLGRLPPSSELRGHLGWMDRAGLGMDAWIGAWLKKPPPYSKVQASQQVIMTLLAILYSLAFLIIEEGMGQIVQSLVQLAQDCSPTSMLSRLGLASIAMEKGSAVN